MPGFSDVLGHEQTIAHMKSAIEANKVSHAYLLAQNYKSQGSWQYSI